ncbi:MAG: amidohydrolase family protein, partial [Chloroflexi bacterium]|nr:amidohydrolase family protein [Chloroflexota bacterium]
VAHMMNYVDAGSAVRAGLNEIEHCSGCAEAMYPERGLSGELWRKIFPDQTREQIDRLIDLLLERGTWMAVTRVIWHKIAHEADPHHWDAPQLRYAPRPLTDWWRTRKPHEQPREYWYDWARAEGAMQIFIAHLIERGVRIIAGSDAPFVHVLPGFGLHEELQLLLDCGMTPIEAIHAATSLAAQALQLDAQVGTLAAGKFADMIIVDGDPTQDIRALQKIWRVLRGGMMLDPAPLLAQAEQYAQMAQPNGVKRFSELY